MLLITWVRILSQALRPRPKRSQKGFWRRRKSSVRNRNRVSTVARTATERLNATETVFGTWYSFGLWRRGYGDSSQARAIQYTRWYVRTCRHVRHRVTQCASFPMAKRRRLKQLFDRLNYGVNISPVQTAISNRAALQSGRGT